jgi:Lhr-like helicase
VDGHLADLRYPPENRNWSNRREGDRLTFGGEEYNIVAINENEVVLSARSGKKTTVRMSVAP